MRNNFAAILFLILGSVAYGKPFKALYLTDFSNFYHDYKEISEEFLPALQERFNFTYDLVGRNQGDLIRTLSNPNFADGYDFIIYNACLADTRDYRLAKNLMNQTAKGIPTVLIHCAMHNFRGTSSELGIVGRNKLKQDIKKWEETYPGESFLSGGNILGWIPQATH